MTRPLAEDIMGKLPDQAPPLHLWRVLYDELRLLLPGDAGLEKAVFDKPATGRLSALITYVHSWIPNATAAELAPAKTAKMKLTPVEGGLKPPAVTEAPAQPPVPAAAGPQVQKQPAAGTPPLAALCFSGGGIRSATFNLGVLQGLAKVGLLGRFDYLSSVSGGGYISSWLARWIC